MECPNCKNKYDSEIFIPLLLTACGHTICKICVEKNFTENAISCLECHQKTNANSVNEFPRNMALLLLNTKKENSPSKNLNTEKPKNMLCEFHNKEIEAFCEHDFIVLCIDCILLNDHKNHSIISIKEAAQKNRETLLHFCENAQKNGETLTSLMTKAHILKEDLAKTAENKKEQLHKVFEEFRNIANERENQLKNDIDLHLAKYNNSINEKLGQISNQISAINLLKKEAEMAKDENNYDFLRKCKIRNSIITTAFTHTVLKLNISGIFPEAIKEKEAIALCRALVSDKPKNNLKSTPYKNNTKKSPMTPASHNSHKNNSIFKRKFT